jgi:hypothetical protein
MQTCERVEAQLHHSAPRKQIEVSGQLHVPTNLPPVEIVPVTHCTGGWVVPGRCLEAKKSLAPAENLNAFPC